MAWPVPIPSLKVLPPTSDSDSWSRSSTPSFKRRRRAPHRDWGLKSKAEPVNLLLSPPETLPPPLTLLQPPSVEISPSSDEEALPWSSCSTPSSSPRRRSFLLRKWLQRDRRDRGRGSDDCSTASNSPRTTPTGSPALRKRLLAPGPSSRSCEGDAMVEKGSDSSSEKGPSQSPNYPPAARNFTRNAKKMQSWYNVLSPTYKQRNEDFRKIFKKLPETERLIVDYSCALQKDILLQGRLYLSENWICFHSNIFRWETTITLQLKDVSTLTKEKTAKLIPNAIQICAEQDKHFFTSFGARDRSYMMIFRLWQNALMEKPLSPKELWHIVHQCYGTELGLTSEDDDYVSPTDHINGIIPGDDVVSELLDLPNDHSSRNSLDLKLDASPLVDHQPNKCCLPSVESSDGGPSFLEDLEPQSESQPDDSSAQTITPLSERAKAVLGNLSSLDFVNDDDIPTDLSDSSDTQDEGEVESLCADLKGRLHINAVYRISVDRLYELLFTDPPFLQDLFEQRRFTDLALNDWQQDNSGTSSRVLSYTIAINNPLGPKTAPVVETQTLYKSSQKNECYVVDSEVITHGIPYQDYFYTMHRYCLTSVSRNKSRLRVSSDIRYRKQPWNLVKVLIEKNTWSGIEEHFRHLELEVSKVEALLKADTVGSENLGKLPALRRRKRNLIRKTHLGEGLGAIGADKERTSRGGRGAGSPYMKPGIRNGINIILLIISFILVVLVALNVLLFYKLWSMERAAHTLETWHSYALSDGKLPQTASEWAQILELQKQFHKAEVCKWKQILKSSVGLLDEMKFSLEKLNRGILTAETPFESEGSGEEPLSQ
ncbi:protein Aster-A-like isoform X2 [Acipenser ruthenus]|uniref:protein Aster-A-like isoform X2 n=1 Tax=Acipenser ruthenus TaxID=7906 RepID=UPI00274059C0|nr:protein Aster-A-like isoform X2 [Acipenser ruthenus]